MPPITQIVLDERFVFLGLTAVWLVVAFLGIYAASGTLLILAGFLGVVFAFTYFLSYVLVALLAASAVLILIGLALIMRGDY